MADKHSEVESKFRAPDISPADLLAYIALETNPGEIRLERYKQVNGQDVYYTNGDDVVRHRFDGKRRTSTLTVKKRKSADSIADRQEVDLPIKEDVPSGDVEAFLKLSGWKPLFAIDKMSYIAHLSCPKPESFTKRYEVCIALYDVMNLNEHEAEAGWERFLEIEVEKDNDCTHEEALAYLKVWSDKLRADFELAEPLNQSLLELYRPKPEQVSRCIA